MHVELVEHELGRIISFNNTRQTSDSLSMIFFRKNYEDARRICGLVGTKNLSLCRLLDKFESARGWAGADSVYISRYFKFSRVCFLLHVNSYIFLQLFTINYNYNSRLVS